MRTPAGLMWTTLLVASAPWLLSACQPRLKPYTPPAPGPAPTAAVEPAATASPAPAAAPAPTAPAGAPAPPAATPDVVLGPAFTPGGLVFPPGWQMPPLPGAFPVPGFPVPGFPAGLPTTTPPVAPPAPPAPTAAPPAPPATPAPPAPPAAPAPTAAPGWSAASAALEDRVLFLVNQHRAAGATCGDKAFAPAPPLTLDGALQAAARAHSRDMATRNYFDHTSPEGQGPGERMKGAGFLGGYSGENIAAGNASAEGTVGQWMKSPGHCSNIMDKSFKVLGVGTFSNPAAQYKHYWTQNFGG